MKKMLLGGILVVAGLITAFFGYNESQTLSSQIETVVSGSGTSPGAVTIVIGVVIGLVGIGLLLSAIADRSEGDK